MKIVHCLLCVLLCSLSFGQEKALDLKTAMQDSNWMGELPENVRISSDNRWIYFDAKRAYNLPNKTLKLSLADNSVSPLDRDHRQEASRSLSYSNGKIRIDQVGGDLWIASGEGKASPLIVRSAYVTFVRFLGDKGFIFREGNNLYRFDLFSSGIVQLTDIRFSKKPEDKDTFYHREEKELIEYVAGLHEADEFREENEAKGRRFGNLEKPKAAYLGKKHRIHGSWFPYINQYFLDISPDGKYVAATLAKNGETDGLNTKYAEFINKDAELKAKDARPRVGHPTKTGRFVFINPSTGEVTDLDVSDLPEIKTDRLKAIKEGQDEKDKGILKKHDEEKPRPVWFVAGGFQGHHFLITAFSRDYKDRWIFTVNARNMEKTLIQHDHDPAWIMFVNRRLSVENHFPGSAKWSRDGEQVLWLSEETGYQHLYAYDRSKKKTRAITKGKFEVHHIYESNDGKYWYFHANREHPGEYHFYRMAKGTHKMEQLTKDEGFHLVTRSLDGKLLVDHFARTNLPPVLRISKDEGQSWKEVYDGRSDAFKAYTWAKPEVISYKNRDGKPVYARLYKPEKPNGAGVIFVHGAGYLQNAHKGWSGYDQEYMFHNLLLQEGYTILDPDFQASAGYGRDWRTAIYRHMGGADLNDIIDGADFLVKEHGLDAKRLGVYGGSYGGFITFMAMFTSPDTFQAGAALRPVTDWAHYNHWYTGRILNTPQTDPAAYRKSSPIYFAEGLKGHLLIAHGMVDDNVQYIDSIRLAQRLIELRKKDWEVASYPVEPHGFRAPSSWYDEYRRIYELFEKTIGQ